MAVEKCTNCERIIGNLETPYIYNEHIVCSKCWKMLKTNSVGDATSKSPSTSIVLCDTKAKNNSYSTNTPLDKHIIDHIMSILNPDQIGSHRDVIEAASRGDAEAINSLGYLFSYTATRATSADMPQDDILSTQLYLESSRRGNVDALISLGCSFLHGKGVSKDAKKAYKLFAMAAERGDSDYAMLWLGVCCQDGDGVTQDYGKAMEFFLKSATTKGGSCAIAMSEIALLYFYGLGVIENHTEAAVWMLKAAEAGDYTAMETLGDMFANGIGVPRSKQQAFYWYQQAIDAKLAAGDR